MMRLSPLLPPMPFVAALPPARGFLCAALLAMAALGCPSDEPEPADPGAGAQSPPGPHEEAPPPAFSDEQEQQEVLAALRQDHREEFAEERDRLLERALPVARGLGRSDHLVGLALLAPRPQALKLLEEAREADPDSATPLVLAGLTHLCAWRGGPACTPDPQRGDAVSPDPEAALPLLREAWARTPDDALPVVFLAVAHHHAGDTDRALRTLANLPENASWSWRKMPLFAGLEDALRASDQYALETMERLWTVFPVPDATPLLALTDAALAPGEAGADPTPATAALPALVRVARDLGSGYGPEHQALGGKILVRVGEHLQASGAPAPPGLPGSEALQDEARALAARAEASEREGTASYWVRETERIRHLRAEGRLAEREHLVEKLWLQDRMWKYLGRLPEEDEAP